MPDRPRPPPILLAVAFRPPALDAEDRTDLVRQIRATLGTGRVGQL
ncbi:MAG: hypothetical protein M0C28_32290 [Candidatus Moduliflexus flocculans]|nr:hypothetical protein [Candidatus Moduliflexus flocculans]